jgi:hypothetical protein
MKIGWALYHFRPLHLHIFQFSANNNNNNYNNNNNNNNPWIRVFLEKLIVTQLLNKSLAFYGTRIFPIVNNNNNNNDNGNNTAEDVRGMHME